MAQDANNEIYPLAFAIVENESESTWKWFLGLIRLHVTQRKGISLYQTGMEESKKSLWMNMSLIGDPQMDIGDFAFVM